MKIGFIGLGNVGGKLSDSLIRNGHDVTVLDMNPDLVAEKVPKGQKLPRARSNSCVTAMQ